MDRKRIALQTGPSKCTEATHSSTGVSPYHQTHQQLVSRECVYGGITCDSVLQHNRPVIACYHPPPPSLDIHLSPPPNKSREK